MTLRTIPKIFSLPIAAVAAAALLTGCATGNAASADQTSAPSASSTTAAVNEELRSLVPKEILDAGVLHVATSLGNPPNVMTGDDGELSGIMYDIGVQAAAVLGLTTEWEDMQFAGIVPGLQSDKFDISMGSLADSPARQEVIDLVDILHYDSVFLIRKGDPTDSADLDHACGKRIGVLAGATQIARVQAASTECTTQGEEAIEMVEYQTPTDAQAQVGSSQLDAYFGPIFVLQHTAATAGNGNTFEVGDVLYDNGTPWAIGMKKDRGQLAEALEGAVRELVENGTYAEILEKYDAESGALDVDDILVNGSTGVPVE